MTLSILSVIALSAMTTTVSAQNNSINVNDVTETNTVVEYNPLGYDWEEFFLVITIRMNHTHLTQFQKKCLLKELFHSP